jgi:cation diffusion facilitator family transporter
MIDIPGQNASIRQITLVGAAVNLALAVIKAAVGLLVGSLALVADAIHSFSDLATDAVVLIGVKLGSRPPDSNHPFGHGKFETLASLIIAGVLIGSGVGIVLKAVHAFSLTPAAKTGWMILGPALLSVILKEWLFRRTMAVSKKTNSTILYANAWHHRADSLSSVVVLIGAGAIIFGWGYGDQAAGLVVGLMIIYAGIKIIGQSVIELGEGGVDRETKERLANILSKQNGVSSWHRLRARSVGREIVMDVHVLVDPKLSVVAGHKISKKVEFALRSHLDRPVNVIVHIEPDLPSERKEKADF